MDFHDKDQSDYFCKLCSFAFVRNQKSSAFVTHHIFHNTNNFFYLYSSGLKVEMVKAGN
jgi:hypothetical protein